MAIMRLRVAISAWPRTTANSAAANGGGTATVDNSITLGPIAANVSVLSAEVSGNTVTIEGEGAGASSNSISESFNEASGINVVGQNTGNNSQIQQNVNVQANLEL